MQSDYLVVLLNLFVNIYVVIQCRMQINSSRKVVNNNHVKWMFNKSIK